MICGYLGLKLYNSTLPLDIDKAEVEQSISSNKLFALFSTDEDYANTTYVEKVIVIEGIVKDVTYLNDRYTVMLHSQNKFSNILCDMSLSQIEDVKKLRTGQTVSIKGVCKGYLMDVIMLNCILVNK